MLTMSWFSPIFLVGLIFLYFFAKFIWRYYILWNSRDPSSPIGNLPLPPGDFGLPIIGETHLWAVQGSRFNQIRREKYGKAFSTNFIGRTMVKVTGPEYVKQILTASHDTVATIWPTTVRKILGESAIANSIGSIHKYRRRAFLKAFTQEALNSYIPQIQESVRKKMQSWSSHTEQTYLIYPETKELTFDVAFRVLVGLSFKNEKERMELFKTFDTMITNLFSLPYDIPGSGFRKALKAKKIIHGILDDHVRKIRRQVYESIRHDDNEKKPIHRNVMQTVLEAQLAERASAETTAHDGTSVREDADENLEMTDVELKETTVEMLFAGYQTTASVSTSAVINLIKSPNVFRKLEEEMRQFGLLSEYPNVENTNRFDHLPEETLETTDETFPRPSLRNRKLYSDSLNNNPGLVTADSNLNESNMLTLEKLSRMTYLEQFMKETLRIMPPILGGYRLAKKTFQIGEFRVPKGWTIIYNIRDTHESEWMEDMDFKPERFSPDNWKDSKESRYRWIPFGGGPRTCIGKEFARLQFKIFIIELIKHFSKLRFAKDKPPRMFAVPFLHPTDGLPVKFTRRENVQQDMK